MRIIAASILAFSICSGDLLARQGGYVKCEGGASWSSKTNIDLKIGPEDWDEAIEGYSSRLGTSPLFAIALGYDFCDLVSLEVSGTWRPHFRYIKHQTSVATLGSKVRYFDLSSKAFMANGYLHGAGFGDWLVFGSSYCRINPFIFGGVGVAYNQMTAFHSVSLDLPNDVFSTAPDKENSSFAWQAGAGIDLEMCFCTIGVGWRYFDAGRFKSQDYFPVANFSASAGEISGIRVDPWRGRLKANEFFVEVRFPL